MYEYLTFGLKVTLTESLPNSFFTQTSASVIFL